MANLFKGFDYQQTNKALKKMVGQQAKRIAELEGEVEWKEQALETIAFLGVDPGATQPPHDYWYKSQLERAICIAAQCRVNLDRPNTPDSGEGGEDGTD